ncbi:hypothetical protein GEMRC1_006465 [Eukaryota sp. GEM-RC1]
MGSEFVFFPDYDEFLTFLSPLSIYDLFTSEIGSVSFGSQFYSTKYCFKNDFSIPVTKRMPIPIDPFPECKDSKFDPFNCPQQHGRRKFIARPTVIGGLNLNSCSIIEDKFDILDLDARVAVLRHYRGYIRIDLDVCTKLLSSSHYKIKVSSRHH